MSKTFVGIGFGPIQSGLFLLEAQASDNFGRFVVAEVVPTVVDAVRRGGGECTVNVASAHGIKTRTISGIEVYNSLDGSDTERLVEAIAEADEIATALPSVVYYDRGTPSPAVLLAQGFQRKLADSNLPPAIVYAAENHNHAAELLRDEVIAALDAADRLRLDDRVQFLNTVIGKMSGVVRDRMQIEQDSLSTLVAGGDSAVLVEEFCGILISQIMLPGIQRGIEVFQEKADLLPFEEAKLYGHNAAHALLGYLSHRRGLAFIHEAASTELLAFVEAAFLEESGDALCQRHANVDELFTIDGWSAYVQDLLVRMVNPHLNDRVDRVIRDPRRKLAWNDRLIGTMRLAQKFGIASARYAAGALAAAELLQQEHPARDIPALLNEVWQDASPPASERDAIIKQILHAKS